MPPTNRLHCPCKLCKGSKMLAWSTVGQHVELYDFCDPEEIRAISASYNTSITKCSCYTCTFPKRSPPPKSTAIAASNGNQDAKGPPVEETQPLHRDDTVNSSVPTPEGPPAPHTRPEGPPAPLARPQYWAWRPAVCFVPVPVQWGAATPVSLGPPPMQLPDNVAATWREILSEEGYNMRPGPPDHTEARPGSLRDAYIPNPVGRSPLGPVQPPGDLTSIRRETPSEEKNVEGDVYNVRPGPLSNTDARPGSLRDAYATNPAGRSPLGPMQPPGNVARRRPPTWRERSAEHNNIERMHYNVLVRQAVIRNKLSSISSPQTLEVIEEFMAERGYQPADWSNIRKDFKMCIKNRKKYKKRVQKKSNAADPTNLSGTDAHIRKATDSSI